MKVLCSFSVNIFNTAVALNRELLTTHDSDRNNIKFIIQWNMIFFLNKSDFPLLNLQIMRRVQSQWKYGRNQNYEQYTNYSKLFEIKHRLLSVSKNKPKKSIIKNYYKHHQLRHRGKKSISLLREQHKWLVSLNCPDVTQKVNLIKYVGRVVSYSSYISKKNCTSENN